MSAIAATASPCRRRQTCSCPTRSAARPSRSNRSPAIPTAARLLRDRQRKPGAHRAVLPAFRRLRRLRHPALAAGGLPRLEAADRGRHAGAGRHRLRGRRTGRCAWRRPPAHHRCMRAAATTASCASALPPRAATPSSPIDRCPILDPGLHGALDAAWALAEALKPRASRSISR